jgi:uncharacterized protein (TIGR03000 family)
LGALVAVYLLVGAGCGQSSATNQETPVAKGPPIALKVSLPQKDAKLWVDGEEMPGEGEERTLTVKPIVGSDHLLVKTLWEPNNYTKITRQYKVSIKAGAKELQQDLREPNPQQKDDIVVRYVPTPQAVVDDMCKMAQVGPKDVVYDLGCGDGRMVITAVKKFAAKRGVGVELDPELVQKSKDNASKEEVSDKVEFRKGDVLKVKDLSDANVVLLYMGDDINKRLKPILRKTLKPGSRVVSHRFLMGDDWKPDRTITVTHDNEKYDVHLWTIKAPEPATEEEDAEKAIKLKVLVPETDVQVWVNGKEYKGEGLERKLEVPPPAKGKDHLVVKILIEPNNYTKITRTGKIAIKEGQTKAVADLRKEDLNPKNRDHIEVRYVPTPDRVVEEMCKMAKVTSKDVVYDLGCGDGRMVIIAIKKFGAKRGVGVDINPVRIKESKENAEKAGVTDKVEFRVGDVLKVKDLSDANVVLLYMGDDINMRLKPILQKTLKPGSRVVSHRFLMGDDWKPDRTITVREEGEDYQLHLWRIGKREAPEENR